MTVSEIVTKVARRHLDEDDLRTDEGRADGALAGPVRSHGSVRADSSDDEPAAAAEAMLPSGGDRTQPAAMQPPDRGRPGPYDAAAVDAVSANDSERGRIAAGPAAPAAGPAGRWPYDSGLLKSEVGAAGAVPIAVPGSAPRIRADRPVDRRSPTGVPEAGRAARAADQAEPDHAFTALVPALLAGRVAASDSGGPTFPRVKAPPDRFTADAGGLQLGAVIARVDDGGRHVAQTLGDLETSLARLFQTQIEALQRLRERALDHERRWIEHAALRRV